MRTFRQLTIPWGNGTVSFIEESESPTERPPAAPAPTAIIPTTIEELPPSRPSLVKCAPVRERALRVVRSA